MDQISDKERTVETVDGRFYQSRMLEEKKIEEKSVDVRSSYSPYGVILLSLSSFGSHFARHALTVLGIYMIQSKFMTTYGMGILFSAISAPSCILPLVIGHVIDNTKNICLIGSILLGLTCIAETILPISLSINSYPLCFFSQFLLGCGATSFTTLQRTLISKFLEEQNGIGIALTITTSNIGKVLGKMSIVPAENLLGGYIEASLVPLFACFGSLLAWILFVKFFRGENSIDREGYVSIPDLPSPTELSRPENKSFYLMLQEFFQSFRQDITFYLLLLIHTLYTTLFHLLLNFLPHYATQRWHVSPGKAALISALPTFIITLCTPIIGLVLDRGGRVVPFLCLSVAIATSAGYFFLFLTELFPPELEVSILAISHAVITTYVLTELSKIVSFDSIGKAFGIVEIFDAFGSLLANYTFAYIVHLTGSYSVGSYGIIVTSLVTGSILFIFLLLHYRDPFRPESATENQEREGRNRTPSSTIPQYQILEE